MRTKQDPGLSEPESDEQLLELSAMDRAADEVSMEIKDLDISLRT